MNNEEIEKSKQDIEYLQILIRENNLLNDKIRDLKDEIKSFEETNLWWTNRFKAIQRDNKNFEKENTNLGISLRASKLMVLHYKKVINDLNKCITNFLATEDYALCNPTSIANNYIDLLKIIDKSLKFEEIKND